MGIPVFFFTFSPDLTYPDAYYVDRGGGTYSRYYVTGSYGFGTQKIRRTCIIPETLGKSAILATFTTVPTVSTFPTAKN